MAGNWIWIVPLVLFFIFIGLMAVFLYLYYREPDSQKRNNTYFVLWIIFAILAGAMFFWAAIAGLSKAFESGKQEIPSATTTEPFTTSTGQTITYPTLARAAQLAEAEGTPGLSVTPLNQPATSSINSTGPVTYGDLLNRLPPSPM